jgi:hypothetical protein
VLRTPVPATSRPVAKQLLYRNGSTKLALFVSISCMAALGATGSAACARCHSDIYRSYMRTPMALTSGHVGSGEFQEDFRNSAFTHARSGVRYRVTREQPGTRFEFDFSDGETRVTGSRRLEYFIGSGVVGRSYLLSVDGFLYQAPVAYYSQERRWRLSPGYEHRDRLYLTRAVGAACLRCHATGVQPVPGTAHGFQDVPFREDGIGCESCHGEGENHIRRAANGEVLRGTGIVNPRKLSPDRRDSICATCHLTGVVRVDKRGREPGSFRPGDLLSDHMSVFVWSAGVPEMTVTSHFEKLAQSRCQTAAGRKVSCDSCHNPHSTPAEAGKAAYFRGKCLSCHGSKSPCKTDALRRRQNGDNCIACHMPKSPVTDVAHAVYTDHSIPRRPISMPVARSTLSKLALFDGGAPSRRDLGMAYAILFETEARAEFASKAMPLLESSVREVSNDAPAVLKLAHLYGSAGQEATAIALYQRVLRADPTQVVAATNLAAYFLRLGRTDEAMSLWFDVLARSPGFEAARLNLATAQLRVGHVRAAQELLRAGLDLNPGSRALSSLLDTVDRTVQ